MTKPRQGIFEKRKYYESGDVNEGRGNTLAVWGEGRRRFISKVRFIILRNRGRVYWKFIINIKR